jgi:WbqC-like protein family
VAKTVASVQSSYIPWKGYFDLIRRSDEFILYDNAQFTKRDWRNRNRIKTPNGLMWLTIPVEVKGKFEQPIKDTRVAEPHWNERHWLSIQANYARAPFFGAYKPVLEELYRECRTTWLSEINYRFISRICDLLSIETRLTWSMDYPVVSGRTERLVGLCTHAGATEYLSGPSAQGYIDAKLFEDAGISLTYMDYQGYPEYPQLHPPFDHQVSIIDLLVHTGPNATAHMLPVPAPSAVSPI